MSISPLSTGIDVNTIVSSLMEAEKLTLNRLTQNRGRYETQFNQYEKLNLLIKQFSDSLTKLSSLLSTDTYKVSSSDNNVLSTVLTSSNAAPGEHKIDITQLAQSQQLASQTFSSRSDALNLVGSLDISVGPESFSLMINGTDSLDKIRDNINLSQSNKGVVASILATTSSTGSPEYSLVLSSKETGTVNAIQIAGDASNQLNLTKELSSAQDALFNFDGFTVTRSSNTISDLLDGITFTLNQANSSATIKILPDTENQNANVKTALSSVVNQYNGLIDLIDKNQSSSSLRDNTYSIIKMQLKNTLAMPVNTMQYTILGLKTAEAVKLINDEGIEYVSIGRLTLDEKQLDQELLTDYANVKSFFTDSNASFVKNFQTMLTSLTKEGGSVQAREKMIKEQESNLDKTIGREETRLDTVRNNLIRRYSELNNFVQHYQNLSNFLEQQLNALDNKTRK
jgi:flagellar hook-associated protein 2